MHLMLCAEQHKLTFSSVKFHATVLLFVRVTMSAKDTVRSNKTTILESLCGDPTLILSKVHEKQLVTDRENRNLRSSNRVNVEDQMVELVDKMMNKGEDTCQRFLNLLQTDEDIRSTYPKLRNIQLNKPLPKPVQACSGEISRSSTYIQLFA